MKCVKCGKKLKNNEKFCTYCGYYNDESEEKNWTDNDELEEDLIDENWYDEDADEKDDEIEIEPVKKEKKKKEDKPKKTKKEKKEKEIKEVKEIKIKEDNEVYDQNERYIEAYIGEDYKLIKKRPFNIWAFLLNWMYVLYRKLYITGVIGLAITAIVAFFFTKYFLIYLIVVVLILGFGFNPYYVFIVKRKVNKMLVKYEGTDSFSLENMCKEFGGVDTFTALIIYLLFLVTIVLSIIKPMINTNHNTKFWKENSENKANCISMTKLIFKEEKSNYDKITEALCKINKTNKTYELYLKTKKDNKVYYVYYETENDYLVFKYNTEYLNSLNKREAENKLTDSEKQMLRDIKAIKTNYESIYKKAKDEDKQIEKKTNKEEKLNYIFDYEELIR